MFWSRKDLEYVHSERNFKETMASLNSLVFFWGANPDRFNIDTSD